MRKQQLDSGKSKFRELAEYKGTDYLADLTKSDALKFKDFLLRKGLAHSSVKNTIGCLSGFWNWGEENQIIKENIWKGLKKRLQGAAPRVLPNRSVLICCY